MVSFAELQLLLSVMSSLKTRLVSRLSDDGLVLAVKAPVNGGGDNNAWYMRIINYLNFN